MIDWKRQDKVFMRNFTESADLHDIVKLIFMRLLRRKHPNRKKCPIYSEFPMQERERIGDIFALIDSDVYVWEIQERITKAWKIKVQKDYEDINFRIISLKNMPRDSIKAIKKHLIKEYLI